MNLSRGGTNNFFNANMFNLRDNASWNRSWIDFGDFTPKMCPKYEIYLLGNCINSYKIVNASELTTSDCTHVHGYNWFCLRWRLSPTLAPRGGSGWAPSSSSEPSRSSGKGNVMIKSSLSWECHPDPDYREDELSDLDVTVTTRPQQSEPVQMPGILSSVFGWIF